MKRILMMSVMVVMVLLPAAGGWAGIIMHASPNFQCNNIGCDAYNLSLESDQGLISAISFELRGDLSNNLSPAVWQDMSAVYCLMIYPPDECQIRSANDSYFLFAFQTENIVAVAGTVEDSYTRLMADFSGFDPFAEHDLAKVVPASGWVSLNLSVVIDGVTYSSAAGDIVDADPDDRIVLITPDSRPTICGHRRAEGDLNCDGVVGLLDLDTLGRSWAIIQIYPPDTSQCDINGDGHCGLLDLDMMGRNWGRLTLVPEPGAAGLLVVGAVMLVRRR